MSNTNLAAAMAAMKQAGPKKRYEVIIEKTEQYSVQIEVPEPAETEEIGEKALEDYYNDENVNYMGTSSAPQVMSIKEI